ncbi:hypothetical protein HPB49_008523 [Dermacentor silvarum]|uniref:Uncharacterized protein n=1 Tax=Dermacentor silvarum TaxID=543639 RepID=A0ACB8DC19_DERSI|nr:hypothetical protein HPB49_008523 [Dermacentor silvarum]
MKTCSRKSPALEVAHSALLSALAVERFLRTSADLSEEQAFFIAICHGMCHPAHRVTGGVVAGSDCNKAMRNFPPFAVAFGCSEGLPMNPALKCSFFQ